MTWINYTKGSSGLLTTFKLGTRLGEGKQISAGGIQTERVTERSCRFWWQGHSVLNHRPQCSFKQLSCSVNTLQAARCQSE